MLHDAAERMSQVIRALRIYSHQDRHGERSIVSLGLQLDAALSLFGDRIRTGIDVVRDYDCLPDYRCCPDQLQHIWLTIVRNALDAMGQKGTLRLKGECAPDGLRISVEDSGPGISEELRPRIFEPFFTTKPHGEGSGLGLSIASEIAAAHGGAISFTSEPGRTVFVVFLPAQGPAAGGCDA